MKILMLDKKIVWLMSTCCSVCCCWTLVFPEIKITNSQNYPTVVVLDQVQSLALWLWISRLNHGWGLNDPLHSDMTGRPRTRGCHCSPKLTIQPLPQPWIPRTRCLKLTLKVEGLETPKPYPLTLKYRKLKFWLIEKWTNTMIGWLVQICRCFIYIS